MRTVLVVDDSVSMRALVTETLRDGASVVPLRDIEKLVADDLGVAR